MRGSGRGTEGSVGLRRQRRNPSPGRLLAVLDLSLRERWGRAKSPGRSRAKVFACQRAGGAGRQGPALNFYRMPAHLASRAAVSDQGPPILVGGRVSETGPGLSELSALTQVRRAGLLPIRFQPHGGPAVVRGGRIRRGWSQIRGAPELALASRARGSRDPGRRRRSRPTLTTPRESVPRRTGRGRHRTKFQGCQGLFSRKTAPVIPEAAQRLSGTFRRSSAIKIPDRAARVRDDGDGISRAGRLTPRSSRSPPSRPRPTS